ncbi:hypothetical protein ACOMICROBIO_NCLOACGD_01408 [Vibrio sp. B1ASS3]|nr:hypothetical protein ACOMICROBIO_NCLOACGD_01408 [Vibrio sp. B1ASS3]CAE6899368.1 hypothetical protein ACOMICROBIO_NCLOACGD_01408 [Vibrio sp. B1ASS3]
MEENVFFMPSETVKDGEKHNIRSTISFCSSLDAILAASAVLPAPGVAWQKNESDSLRIFLKLCLSIHFAIFLA